MYYLEAKNIVKQYASHKALDNVTVQVPQNHIYGLLGPNGAGKTTLIRIINHITIEGADRDGKARNYAVVQELAEEFKRRNGALKCADLLGLSKKEPIVSTPEARTSQYYAKRPCVKMVEEAARIWCEYLEKATNEC